MNNNIIEKDGETYGFYNDLLEFLKSEIIEEVKNNNYAVISDEWADLLEQLTSLKEYGGIIKLTDNNGMGWTAEKYQYKEN